MASRLRARPMATTAPEQVGAIPVGEMTGNAYITWLSSAVVMALARRLLLSREVRGPRRRPV